MVGVVQYEAAIQLPSDFYTRDLRRQADDEASQVDKLIEMVLSWCELLLLFMTLDQRLPLGQCPHC